MKPKAYIGAILAAAVGAAAWAAVSHFLSVESGWLAWGIGALVGGVAYSLGGRGPISGGTAVVLTIASILAGKAIALDAGVEQYVVEQSELSEDFHRAVMSAAAAYPGAEDREALREFVVEWSFGETGSDEEIVQFLANIAPDLERFAAEAPDFEAWREQRISSAKEAVYAELGWFEIYKQTFSLFDLIFVALGVTTAFKLAGRPEELFSGGGAAAAFQRDPPGTGGTPPAAG